MPTLLLIGVKSLLSLVTCLSRGVRINLPELLELNLKQLHHKTSQSLLRRFCYCPRLNPRVAQPRCRKRSCSLGRELSAPWEQTVHPKDSTLALQQHFHLEFQLFVPQMLHHTPQVGLRGVNSTIAPPASPFHPREPNPAPHPGDITFIRP